MTTWMDEAKMRDPMESAKKYAELMEDFGAEDQKDEELMSELDILWHAAMRSPDAAKIVQEV